ncbi:MAG TPA: DUF3501 family protein [Acidimicrobiales bacterium]|jgi:hypothetical protein
MSRPLVIDEIDDLRTYERGRDAYRRGIIALKRRRRIAVGPFVTLLFENRETVRFQVQEMARAERMMSDEQIQGELDIYNALLPSDNELSATMFIELTTEAELREWLPKLVGVERSVELRFGDPGPDVAPGRPEASHEEALTRPTMTASVHYVRFRLSPDQVARVAGGPVTLAVTHPEYRYETVLGEETRRELAGDLMG